TRARTLAHHALLLHLLREVLGATAQSLKRATLRVDRTVRIALTELALRITHRLASLAELVTHALLALLTLLAALAPLALLTLLAWSTLRPLRSDPPVVALLDQRVRPVAACLLVLRQIAHPTLVALLTLLALLALLTLLPLLVALALLVALPLLAALTALVLP